MTNLLIQTKLKDFGLTDFHLLLSLLGFDRGDFEYLFFEL